MALDKLTSDMITDGTIGPNLGSSDEWIRTNSNQINQDIIIPSGTNALSVGPINLNVANSITVNGVYTII
jgi:hypothetical protein